MCILMKQHCEPNCPERNVSRCVEITVLVLILLASFCVFLTLRHMAVVELPIDQIVLGYNVTVHKISINSTLV